jgi:hypothetical protein
MQVRLTFLHHAVFVAAWRASKLGDEDLRALEALLLENPERGPVMSGTGGLRKLRFAPPSWHMGKSGAVRVGYVYVPEVRWVVLVLMFSKNVKANVSGAERSQIKALLDRLRRNLPKGDAQ